MSVDYLWLWKKEKLENQVTLGAPKLEEITTNDF